jgi:hypothetical protein
MFIISKYENKIHKVQAKTFSELKFKEREHLQEWIEGNPEALGEELLIIQKEFSGFSDTNERLDLLALDKQGNIVVIENKLDDTGKDVTWQVLKYASYCSSLSKQNIKNIYQEYLTRQGSKESAEEKLSEFFDNKEFEELQLNKGLTQRIILVAGNFRKEVTSTVLWLMNYKLRIQCFKVTPFQYLEQLFLNIEQIIPMKGAEDYAIIMADKTQEDIDSQEELKTRHKIRKEFWGILLKECNKRTDLFKNISPGNYHWIGAGVGVRGLGLNFGISKNYARTELYIDRGDFHENKFIFDTLFKDKELIESVFGDKLEWERLDDKRASRIKYENTKFNVFDKDCWEEMINFMVDAMVRLERSLKTPIKKVAPKLKNFEKDISNDNKDTLTPTHS